MGQLQTKVNIWERRPFCHPPLDLPNCALRTGSVNIPASLLAPSFPGMGPDMGHDIRQNTSFSSKGFGNKNGCSKHGKDRKPVQTTRLHLRRF
jgi:hypothetical protein